MLPLICPGSTLQTSSCSASELVGVGLLQNSFSSIISQSTSILSLAELKLPFPSPSFLTSQIIGVSSCSL